ncbi:hypothetical protein AB6A40_001160 [Gnathostoma spinigerum]|uniref:Dystroglycan 1 n=1 Tax=Gnathostoma spinigerum TaxID=75299 RepID=A0ABD6E4T2_9BILA
MVWYIHLALLIASSSGFSLPETVNIHVGQLFSLCFPIGLKHIKVKDASDEPLASWLRWNDADRCVEGIPPLYSVGQTFLRITEENGGDDVVELRISEENTNPCGEDSPTLWLDFVFEKPLQYVSLEDQLNIINSLAGYYNANRSQIRIYDDEYVSKIRATEIMESTLGKNVGPKTTVVSWNISCEELDDDATEIVERAITATEDELKMGISPVGWRLTNGLVVPRQQRIIQSGRSSNVQSILSGFATNEPISLTNDGSTTRPTVTTVRITRTTRKVDSPPVRLNSLPTFTCKRGAVCRLQIPEKTFIDVEDGDTRSLSLSVFPLDGEKNWLTVDRVSQVLHGIPLNQGDFGFRLEARDSSNQMTSAAFRVSVEEAAPSNHLFILEIQQSFNMMTKDPYTLYQFAERLAKSLGDRYPNKIIIRDISAGNHSRTVIKWSNATLSHKVCQMKALDAIKYSMLTRRRDRIRTEFLRAMDSRFHVRSVKLQFQDSCLAENISTTISVPTESDIASTSPSASNSPVWLLLAISALLLLLLSILVLICCITRKRHAKAVQSDFVSKGLPVVFPEEMPQEDDSANVASPMLVKEERPPLIISQHENPLYKPSIPLSSSSPRVRSSATNQRLPPAYVPP